MAADLASDRASQQADSPRPAGYPQSLDHRQVWVCQYTNCLENGSAALLTAFEELIAADATGSPCQGQCNLGPTVRILPDEIWYYRVQPADVAEIVATHLQQGQPIDRLLNPRLHPKY